MFFRLTRTTRPVNLHQLELFCAILEKGSFSLAARELYLSQPALGVQMKRLEESLGVPLLRRSRGGVQPIPAGAELYASAHRAMEQLRAAEHRLAAIREGAAARWSSAPAIPARSTSSPIWWPTSTTAIRRC